MWISNAHSNADYITSSGLSITGLPDTDIYQYITINQNNVFIQEGFLDLYYQNLKTYLAKYTDINYIDKV